MTGPFYQFLSAHYSLRDLLVRSKFGIGAITGRCIQRINPYQYPNSLSLLSGYKAEGVSSVAPVFECHMFEVGQRLRSIHELELLPMH